MKLNISRRLFLKLNVLWVDSILKCGLIAGRALKETPQA
jgi:hypothetical protein